MPPKVPEAFGRRFAARTSPPPNNSARSCLIRPQALRPERPAACGPVALPFFLFLIPSLQVLPFRQDITTWSVAPRCPSPPPPPDPPASTRPLAANAALGANTATNGSPGHRLGTKYVPSDSGSDCTDDCEVIHPRYPGGPRLAAFHTVVLVSPPPPTGCH